MSAENLVRESNLSRASCLKEERAEPHWLGVQQRVNRIILVYFALYACIDPFKMCSDQVLHKF